MELNKNGIVLFVISLVLFYGVLSFFIIQDYGFTIDEHDNASMGHKYLRYFSTGYLNFKDDLPKVEPFSHFYIDSIKNVPHVFFPLANTLSASCYHLFYKRLNILDPIAAHNIITPILMALFLLLLFFFARKHYGTTIGIATILALITNPRVFGHTFIDIKDIPETIFFSVTLMFFVNWVTFQKLKYLYFAFISFAFCLTTRLDGIQIPPILFLWQIPYLYKSLKDNINIKFRTLYHWLICISLTFLIIIILTPPFQPWAYSTKKEYFTGAINFFIRSIRYTIGMGTYIKSSWNLYAPSQIFYTTPIIMLILFMFGFFSLLKKLSHINLLLIIWFLLPVLRHCFPNVNHYDGIRHFIVFIIPFAIIIAIGIDYASHILQKITTFNKKTISLVIIFLFTTVNIFHLIKLHPYQSTFYNFITGGLGGAQKKDIPFSSDYWLSSFRQASIWLNKNATKNAFITTHMFNSYGDCLLNPYKLRKDLKIINFNTDEFNKSSIPFNTYIIDIPRRWNRLDWPKITPAQVLVPEINKLRIVHQVKRQNGIIFTIYYNS